MMLVVRAYTFIHVSSFVFYSAFKMYWPKLFFVYTMTIVVGSQSLISLLTFMFVSATVSEIHCIPVEKKKLQMAISI